MMPHLQGFRVICKPFHLHEPTELHNYVKWITLLNVSYERKRERGYFSTILLYSLS